MPCRPAVHRSVKGSARALICSGILAGAAIITPATAAEPLIGLQRAVVEAQKRGDVLGKERLRLHQDTLKALAVLARAGADASRRAGALAAFAVAEQREASAAIGGLQATAAYRRARQALTEAVNDAVEQGEAVERAAARAGRGEVAPSVSDLLICDGPDCVLVTAREHTALVLMGAVGPSFDPTRWPPKDAPPPITVLAYAPGRAPLAELRRAADEAAQQAEGAGAEAGRLREELRADPSQGAIAENYAGARAKADAAVAERNGAEARLQRALRNYGDAGRGLQRAALLAGDGYVLKSGRRQACNAVTCIAAEGLEAAAFIVLGAAENMSDSLKRFQSLLAPGPSGGLVFR